METPFKPVTHVIFDVDGLLLDTENIYVQVTRDIVEQYGKTYTTEIHKSVMGLVGKQVAELIVNAFNLPLTLEEYRSIAFERYKKLMPEAKLMPGAEKLIRHLHNHKIPMALATSSCTPHFNLKTQNHRELFSLFQHTVNGSDSEIKNGKPHPDIFLICASRFEDNPPPHKCLVLEDSYHGVRAARDAGMQCIMVPDYNLISDHNDTDATLVLNSLKDINLELFGLPAL